MRRLWTDVSDVLGDLRRKFSALPPPLRDAYVDALDQVARALAKSFARRSARFLERRFLEIVGAQSFAATHSAVAAEVTSKRGDDVAGNGSELTPHPEFYGGKK
jgi:hypothetical protein